jgi:hypothetical protein
MSRLYSFFWKFGPRGGCLIYFAVPAENDLVGQEWRSARSQVVSAVGFKLILRVQFLEVST